ncbi:C2H2 and C2HC zinc finger [Glarea lozoyensis ATCC 20868]|uniref:C2H2 and C2HC zinc finger n=1 Tax=Glarea lozoyensis (strain ATCC 20868 / MF5171) TaxID=1116229 RepID=S3D8L5_GLAL2|nr:C2H2 and C2HC zinc finger [Glarea lozoyensis ATCC 20868]EPE34797.1 C2H2 and C2HC zinc finger [Glarea lozoyensis ATCC 20868]
MEGQPHGLPSTPPPEACVGNPQLLPPETLAQGNSQIERVGSDKATHQCPLCPRKYERADHLSRHLKTHENARSHRCNQCSKRFNRADLLSRHESSHNRTPGKRKDDGDRVLVACRACIASKSKCQDEKPCVRCVTKGIRCEVSPNRARAQSTSLHKNPAASASFGNRSSKSASPRRLNGEGSAHQGQLSRSSEIEEHMGDDTEGVAYREQLSGFSRDGSANGATMMGDSNAMEVDYDEQSIGVAFQTAGINRGSSIGGGALNSVHLSSVYDQPPAEQFISLADQYQFTEQFGFIPRNTYFGEEDDFDMWEMDGAGFEFQPFMESAPTQERQSEKPVEECSSSSSRATKLHAAFEKSAWIWNPTQNDHSLNDQTNLEVDDTNIAVASTPETPGTTMDQFLFCCIDSSMRDRILHIIFNLRVYHTPIRAFPPLSLLNLLIQVHFAQSKFNADHLIHAASFDSKLALPELVLAITAAGANAILTPSIRRMGLALQEIVRHTIAELWERNNANTRRLQTIQAWILNCEIGLWSGVKRKMEIAESFLQPVIVMMRRSGVFAMGKTPSDLRPTKHDPDAVLHAKWNRFIERESYKRLALRTFIQDAQASSGFQKPPQISFTELDFDLPSSQDLWLAQSPVQWRDVYLEKQDVDIPMLLEAMQNPELLSQSEALIDSKACAMAITAGHWGQIWRLAEAKKFYPTFKAAYRLSLMTEQDELYRALISGVASMSDLCKHDPSIALFGEFFLMVSHEAPEDIQRFAGKFGPEESRKVFGTFQEWSNLPESRMTIWHAGQVLRAAAQFNQCSLKDFYAVAVYYAALTLWIYGTMLFSREKDLFGPVSHQRVVNTETISDSVALNQAENESVKTFRVVNKGTPGLVVIDNDQIHRFKPLSSTRCVLEYAQNILRTNFSNSHETLPGMIESLANLMADLSSLPEGRNSRMATEGPD